MGHTHAKASELVLGNFLKFHLSSMQLFTDFGLGSQTRVETSGKSFIYQKKLVQPILQFSFYAPYHPLCCMEELSVIL